MDLFTVCLMQFRSHFINFQRYAPQLPNKPNKHQLEWKNSTNSSLNCLLVFFSKCPNKRFIWTLEIYLIYEFLSSLWSFMYIDVLLRRLMIVLYSFVVSGAFIHFAHYFFDIFYFTQTKGQQISVISGNEMSFLLSSRLS